MLAFIYRIKKCLSVATVHALVPMLNAMEALQVTAQNRHLSDSFDTDDSE
jgi:hypothetical protein